MAKNGPYRANLQITKIEILLALAFLCIPIASGFSIETASFSSNATHMGLAGNAGETSSFSFRSTTTYQQGSNDNVETSSFAANAGWFEQVAIAISKLNLTAPGNFTITKLNETAVFLNWTNVSGSFGFNLYISDDAFALSQLNVNNLSSDITRIANLTAINHTDNNASQTLLRFYRVSAFSDTDEQVTATILGKQTFVFRGVGGTGNSFHRQNWIGFVINSSLFAEQFLQDIGNDALRMNKLDKNNATDFSVVVHEKGTQANNFSLEPGRRYVVETSGDVNLTIVGNAILALIDFDFLGLGGTSNSFHRQNWFSVLFTNVSYTAESLLNAIGNASLRINKLTKNNATDFSIVVHEKGTQANNFTIIPGEGYTVETSANATFTIGTPEP